MGRVHREFTGVMPHLNAKYVTTPIYQVVIREVKLVQMILSDAPIRP